MTSASGASSGRSPRLACRRGSSRTACCTTSSASNGPALGVDRREVQLGRQRSEEVSATIFAQPTRAIASQRSGRPARMAPSSHGLLQPGPRRGAGVGRERTPALVFRRYNEAPPRDDPRGGAPPRARLPEGPSSSVLRCPTERSVDQQADGLAPRVGHLRDRDADAEAVRRHQREARDLGVRVRRRGDAVPRLAVVRRSTAS